MLLILPSIRCYLLCVRASLGRAPQPAPPAEPGIWNISKMKLHQPRPPAEPGQLHHGQGSPCALLAPAACVYVFTAKSWWEIGKNYRL